MYTLKKVRTFAVENKAKSKKKKVFSKKRKKKKN
jgi:hypothetical protein